MEEQQEHPEPTGSDLARELSSREKERLIDLLCQLTDDRLNGDELDELRAWLEASQATRSEYLQYYSLHAALGASSVGVSTEATPADPLSQDLSSGTRAETPNYRQRISRALSIPKAVGWAAGLLTAAVVMGLLARPGVRSESERTRVGYVAALAASESSVWELTRNGVAVEHHNGLLLPGDALTLSEGSLDLRFMNGVEAALDPGSSMLLASERECVLTRGAIRAVVPPGAEGFVVDTPYGRILDLGTEFGVRVGEDVGVRVYRGEVKLTPSKRLTTVPVEARPPGSIQLQEGDNGRLVLDNASGSVAFIDSEAATDFPELPVGRFSRSGRGFLAIESFSQGRTGARALDRNGGLGWSTAWADDRVESSSVSFMVSDGALLSRGSGDGAIQRRLSPVASALNRIYFSAVFRMDGYDPECSVWLELYQHDEQRWSNGETDVAAIGITDGKLSGRLAPWFTPAKEKSLYDLSPTRPGSSYCVVGRLDFAGAGQGPDSLSVWVDPTLDREDAPDLVIRKEAIYDRIDSIAVRCWELDGAQACIDDIRVTDQWKLAVE